LASSVVKEYIHDDAYLRYQVNKALLDINKQMNLKVSLAEISNTLQEQSLINSALVTELCLGRWIWKSLKTKAGMQKGLFECLKLCTLIQKLLETKLTAS
jgi:hypothetical protein